MIIYSWQSNKIDKNFNRLYNDHQINNDTGYPFSVKSRLPEKKQPLTIEMKSSPCENL